MNKVSTSLNLLHSFDLILVHYKLSTMVKLCQNQKAPEIFLFKLIPVIDNMEFFAGA